MTFIILVQPVVQKTIQKSVVISAVRGRVNVELTMLDKNYDGTFYFEILDSTGGIVETINARRPAIFEKIKSKIMGSGATEEQAINTANLETDNIFRAILAGKPAQKFAAMSLFAGSYGLTLLPMPEQKGVLTIK